MMLLKIIRIIIRSYYYRVIFIGKKMEFLTKQAFLEKVFDYETKDKWEYQGELPAIIDFYADWCAPCRMISPIMEELAEEYKGKVNIYKIDTEEEQELAAVFGIRSIPSVLFIPKDGQPQMAIGAMPKEEYIRAIEMVLGVPHPSKSN